MWALGLGRKLLISTLCVSVLAVVASAQGISALERVRFSVAGDDAVLEQDLRDASLVVATFEDRTQDPREVFAAALADYRALVEALYANGYYSGVVRIRVDGREAADFTLLDVPQRIDEIVAAV